jgi:hypothetical protein
VVFPLAVSPDDPGPAGTGIETETVERAGQKDRFFARP